MGTNRAVAVMAACGLVASALGFQPGTNPPRNPGLPRRQTPAPPPVAPPAPANQPTPAAQPAAPEVKAVTVGRYIEQTNPRDLTLAVHVAVNSDNPLQKDTYRDPFTGDVVQMPKVSPFEFNTLAVVFPQLPSTASSDPFVQEFAGRLTVNDLPADDAPEIMNGYSGGVKLARWDAGDRAQTATARQVELSITIPMRCYRTRFWEADALKVPWPAGGWPVEAQSVGGAQLYLETGVDGQGQVRPFDDAAVTEALARWLAEAQLSSAKAVGPVALAKILTAKVWGSVQADREGLAFKRTGEISGVVLQPPALTLAQGRGSEIDIAVLLAAVMRKAGLPARMVVGWDVGEGNSKFLSKSSKQNRLRAWVEFCLYDEAASTINWVPVDVAALRRTTSRPTALTREWRFFGTHDELDRVTPFAMHFHPPTDVVSYGWPAFWGWFVTPQAPKAAEQSIRFAATMTSTRGGTPPRDPKADPSRR